MMNWTPDQLKTIEALKDKIIGLCSTATRLPGEVGVSGFVFEPTTGLVLHFGNVMFPEARDVYVLHEILATAILRIKRMKFPVDDLTTAIEGGKSDDIEVPKTEAPNEFALADELAKLVLMLPPQETSPEVVSAAQTYVKSRILE